MKHVVFTFISLSLAAPAWSQSTEAPDVPDMPEGCSLHAENGFMRLVVCTDENATQETYVVAGKAACETDLPCGAWIWSDVSLPPAEAPDNHDGLTQEQITSSKGVWVAENSAFIAIDKAN